MLAGAAFVAFVASLLYAGTLFVFGNDRTLEWLAITVAFLLILIIASKI